MAKILLVEDEENLRDILRMNLDLEGYQVQTSTNGKEAVETLLKDSFDIILLDVMLPHLDGFSVCTEFRKKNQTTPIIFLTAKGDAEDRINGLKIGADDYLVKPFHLEELLLRVKNLLIRSGAANSPASQTNELSFGQFSVDFNTFEVRKNYKKIAELSQREIKLIKLLSEKPNQVVSRSEILDRIWGEEAFPTSRTIDNYILAFRKLFEENPKEPRFFHSVRGVGYKFTP